MGVPRGPQKVARQPRQFLQGKGTLRPPQPQPERHRLFEAGNFYADFILRLRDGDTQHIVFLDPKGIRHSEGWNDSKIMFHKEIKRLEERLGDPGIHLHFFMLSATAFQDLLHFGEQTKREDFDAAGVLFLNETAPHYLDSLFRKITFVGQEVGR